MALSLGHDGALLHVRRRPTGQGDVSLARPWGPIALVAANLFVIGFGASWGPLVWVLLGEIFPSRIRGKALGVAAGAQWIANFLITVSFPAMSSWSLPLTYGMYAVFAALSFFFVLWKIPETKGMELEQTETLFVQTKPSDGGMTTHAHVSPRRRRRRRAGSPGGAGAGSLDDEHR